MSGSATAEVRARLRVDRPEGKLSSPSVARPGRHLPWILDAEPGGQVGPRRVERVVRQRSADVGHRAAQIRTATTHIRGSPVPRVCTSKMSRTADIAVGST